MSSSSFGALLHPLERLDNAQPRGLSALALGPAARQAASNPAAQEAVAPQTEQAVQAVAPEDVVAPSAQRLADIQATIAQLNDASNATDAASLLRTLSQLVTDGTQAGLIPDTLGQLADLADSLLTQANSAQSGNLSLAIQAQFSFSDTQSSGPSGTYQQTLTSFSLRFSMATDDTQFDGALSFQDSYQQQNGQMQYQSVEQIKLRLRTTNPNPTTNDALATYGAITQQLTGIDVLANLQQAPAQASASQGTRSYVAISRQQQLTLYVGALSSHGKHQQQLLEALKQLAQNRQTNTTDTASTADNATAA